VQYCYNGINRPTGARKQRLSTSTAFVVRAINYVTWH